MAEICHGCDKPAKTKKGWCSAECYRKNQKSNKGQFKQVDSVSVRCEYCGKEERKKPYQAKRYRFCSLSCARDHRRTPRTQSNCLNCSKEIFRSPYDIKVDRHKFCSKECYREYDHDGRLRETGRKTEWVEKNCEICGVPFEVPPCRLETSRFCSRKCSSIEGYKVQSEFGFRTSIECKMRSTLLQVGVAFSEQHPISNITVPDFFIEPNIAIYTDGDYWHSLEDVRERDERINEYLLENGYEVYRFSESEINTDIESINNVLTTLGG